MPLGFNPHARVFSTLNLDSPRMKHLFQWC